MPYPHVSDDEAGMFLLHLEISAVTLHLNVGCRRIVLCEPTPMHSLQSPCNSCHRARSDDRFRTITVVAYTITRSVEGLRNRWQYFTKSPFRFRRSN